MREKLAIALVLVGAAVGGSALSSANVMSSSTNPANSFSTKSDWVKPFSAAGSPASTTDATIPVTYTYGDAGSEVKEVELWVKRPGDAAYSLAATDTDPSSASFGYLATAGPGAYAFYTRARDNAGNYEDAPGAADSTTSLSSGDALKPESSAGSPATSTTAAFNVGISASDTGGLASVELWVKRPGDAGYSLVHTYTASGASFSTTHAYTAAAGEGSYSFYTRAKDAAANYEDAPASPDSTTVYDAATPTSAASSPTYANAAFDVTYTASDGGSGSGVDEVELWVRQGTSGAFSLAETDTTPASPTFSYSPSGPNGTYQFYTRARDNAGNYENAPSSPAFDDSTLFDTVKPAATIGNGVGNNSSSSPITVTYDAPTDAGGAAASGVKEVELWVRRPGDPTTGPTLGYSHALTDTDISTRSFSYTPDDGEGVYRFIARARDNAGNLEDIGAGQTSGEDSTTFTKRPRAIAVAATDGGGTPGKLQAGDVLTLTFDEAINTASIKSTWTNPATAQTPVTVAVTDSGANDSLSVSSYDVGVVSTAGDYVSGAVNFNSSTMTINGDRTVLTIVFGAVSDATRIRAAAVTAKNMTFNPNDNIQDINGNAVENFNPVESDNDVDF